MLKIKMALALSLFIVGCGDDVTYLEEVTTVTAQDFEGIYECDNNSYLELEQDSNQFVRFDTSYQKLVSLNPENSTFGTHPTISDSNVLVAGNELLLKSRNYRYSSSTNDIEEDDSGSNINGTKQTDVSLKLKENGNLKLKIEIWANAMNSNINFIIATRTFNCKRQ